MARMAGRCASALWVVVLMGPAVCRAQPSPAEQQKLDALDAAIDGGVVFTRSGSVYLVVVGDWNPVELGPGRYARWGPDAGRIAVLESDGDVFVMNADGSGRTRLATGASTDNCPLEFHPNGREVIWLEGGRWKATDIFSQDTRDLMDTPPHSYSGEASLSADGARMACRASHDLYAVDLAAGTDRLYADGCSAGVSPDGGRLMNNTSGHDRLAIRDWDGGNQFELHASNGCEPDGSWDNHHWSNHDDYIAAKGDGSEREAYLIHVGNDRTTRVTWIGDVDYPDLVVGTVAVPDPRIRLDPSSVSFAAVAGGANPSNKTVAVTNAGGGTLGEVEVSDDADWLTVTRSGSGNRQELLLEVDVTGLATGSYPAEVVVSGGGAPDAATCSVELTVSEAEQPVLALEPAEVRLSSLEGGAGLTRDVIVENAGTGTLEQVAAEVAFDDGDGWLQARPEGSGNDQALVLEVEPAGLALGSYGARVEVACSNASNSPMELPVVLEVVARPSITVTEPAAGTVWRAGEQARVRWTTEVVDDCSIMLSTDGGASFPIVLSVGVDVTSEHWLDWPVEVPNVDSDRCVVMVQDYNDPYPNGIFAMSDEFVIEGSDDRSLALTYPTGGEVLAAGDTGSVRWEAERVETAVVEFSPVDGERWTVLATVGAAEADWGALPWTVPPVATGVARVRVRTTDGGVEAVSGRFTILASGVDPDDLELTAVRLGGRLADPDANISLLQVDGTSVQVSEDGTFETTVQVPAGVAGKVVELAAAGPGGRIERLIEIGVEDTAPPIPGLGVSAAELRAFVGGRGGVLVWVDAGGSIQVLDFRVDAPRVETLVEAGDCINPLVSPDASRVVYSRGQANGPKFIRVRALGGGEPALVGTGDLGYWSFAGGREAVVYCDWSEKTLNGEGGATWLQELETGGTRLVGDAEQLCARAMDAGPNGTLRWLGQVYGQLWAYDLDAGVEYPTEKFELMGGGVADHQTCNGSMAPDASGRLMCLVIPHDYVRVFGYREASDTWQQEAELELRAGMAEWEFPEWSTDAGYFTAVMRGPDLQNRLFIVKMETGRVVPEALEVSGEERGMTYSHLYLEP